MGAGVKPVRDPWAELDDDVEQDPWAALDSVSNVHSESPVAAPVRRVQTPPTAVAPDFSDVGIGESSQAPESSVLERGLQIPVEFAKGAVQHPLSTIWGLAKPIANTAQTAFDPGSIIRTSLSKQAALSRAAKAQGVTLSVNEAAKEAFDETLVEMGKDALATGGLAIFGPLEGRVAEALAARGLGPLASKLAGATAAGVVTGPAFFPEDPVAGAIGGGLLAPATSLAMKAAGKGFRAIDDWAYRKADEIRARRARGMNTEPAPESEQIGTRKKQPPPADASARVVDEPPPKGPSEPDFKVDPWTELDNEAPPVTVEPPTEPQRPTSLADALRAGVEELSPEPEVPAESGRSPNALRFQPGSRYEAENEPGDAEQIYETGRDIAMQSHVEATRIRDVLGRVPNMKPERKQKLEQELADHESTLQGTLSEMEQAFGIDIADELSQEVTGQPYVSDEGEVQEISEKSGSVAKTEKRADRPKFVYFSGKHSATIQQMAQERGDVGLVVSPLVPHFVKHMPSYPSVMVDNGAFSKAKPYSDEAFTKLLDSIDETPGAKEKVEFVVAPDVPMDAEATLAKFKEWAPKISARGHRVAFAAQNGIEKMRDQIPWADFDVLFIGGSTDWKLGTHENSKDKFNPNGKVNTEFVHLIRDAAAHDKDIHVGRVNSEIRAILAGYGYDATSADGNVMSHGEEANRPRVEKWLNKLNSRDTGKRVREDGSPVEPELEDDFDLGESDKRELRSREREDEVDESEREEAPAPEAKAPEREEKAPEPVAEPEPEPKEEVKPFDTRDPHEVLGVDKNATPEQIKDAYRKLAAVNHPDRHQGDAVYEERFKQIAEAFQTLTNPALRKRYDTSGQTSRASNAQARHTWQQYGPSKAEWDEIINNFRKSAKERQEAGPAESGNRQAVDETPVKRDTTPKKEPVNEPLAPRDRAEPEERPSERVQSDEGSGRAGTSLGRGSEPSGNDVRADTGRAQADASSAERPGSQDTSAAPEDAERDGGGDSVRQRPDSGRERSPEHQQLEKQPAAENYRITPDDKIGEGTPKQKIAANLEAIRTMQRILAEGRTATAEEQRALVRYTGWGAHPGVFLQDADGNFIDREFADVGEELKELLSPDEFREAAASTKNAHYTAPEVIAAMYRALEHMGFKHGKALEPSLGVGHFIGMAPHKYSWHGTELDPITAKIAMLLYPQASIKLAGFETQKAAGAFDFAIGNVPFGNYPVHDKNPKYKGLSIHNYFFAKTLEHLKPGGVMAYVTSRYTMDSQDRKARNLIAAEADFLGAVRLPSGAFRKNAGTDVITDIIFVRKRLPDSAAQGKSWIESKQWRTVEGDNAFDYINEYYHAHPEMMLGNAAIGRGHHKADEFTLRPKSGLDLEQAITAALDKELPADIAKLVQRPDHPATRDNEEEILAPDNVREGSFTIHDGKLKQKLDGKLVPAPVSKENEAKVKHLVTLKNQLKDYYHAQYSGRADAEVEKLRVELNKTHDAFVKKYGAVTKEERTETSRVLKTGENQVLVKQPNLRPMYDDPEWVWLQGIEKHDEDADTYEKSDALLGRTIEDRHPPKTAETADRALLAVLADAGYVDIDRVAEMVNTTPEEAKAALRGLIFENPSSGDLEIRETYLSGNVRVKLQEAREAAEVDERFKENVEALEKVQPTDLKPAEIYAHIGSTWIPGSDYEQFIKEVTGESGTRIQRIPLEAKWKVLPSWYAAQSTAATQVYGIPEADMFTLLEDAFNQKSTKVYKPDPENPEKRIVDQEKTLAAQEKQQALKEKFAEWVWEDPGRSSRLAADYNWKMNAHVDPVYDGRHLTLPGAIATKNGEPFALRPHQKNAIWRALQKGNTLLAHAVGAGKTYTLAAIAMESKRLGLARKPLLIFPNHMLEQWAHEFKELYPTANLLVARAEDFNGDKRRQFVSRAASQNWDAILMTHSSFGMVPMSADYEAEYLSSEIEQYRQAWLKAREDRLDRSIQKRLENALERREKRLKELLDKKKDDVITFENMGVDLLLVDELHEFKNLEFSTGLENVSPAKSQKATDLYMKSRYLESINPGRSFHGATGTPIANSVAEVYNMMKYTQLPTLLGLEMGPFDAWAANFGKTITSVELDPTGGRFRQKDRFAAFENVGDLAALFRQVWDVLLPEDLRDIVNLPRIVDENGKETDGEVVVAPKNSLIADYVTSLGERADAIKKGQVDPSEDNFLKITTDGRHAGLDMRLVDASAPDMPESKVNLATQKIYDIWQKSAGVKGTQLVFLDLSAPDSDPSEKRGGVPGLSIYTELKEKLIAKGIPAFEVRFIHEATNARKKKELFKLVREGKVRVLIGSTQKMGVGTNVQDRIVALHDLDVPWRPDQLEQRRGRAIRQGNKLVPVYSKTEFGEDGSPKLLKEGRIPGIRVLRYVSEGSFDAYMWQTVARKATFIGQGMRADAKTRTIEDVDAAALTADEIKAIATGNPLIQRKAVVDAEVAKLSRLKTSHDKAQRVAAADLKNLPVEIQEKEKEVADQTADAEVVAANPTNGDKFKVTLDGKEYTDRKGAGEELRRLIIGRFEEQKKSRKDLPDLVPGKFAGLDVIIRSYAASAFKNQPVEVYIALRGKDWYPRRVTEGDSSDTLRMFLENRAEVPVKSALGNSEQLNAMRRRLDTLKKEAGGPFKKEAELAALLKEQKELEQQLSEKPAESGRDFHDHDGDNFMESEEGSLDLAKVVADIRKFWKKKGDFVPLVESDFQTVEDRWRKARGVKKPGLLARMGAALGNIRDSFARHFEHIDESASPKWAETQNILLQVEHAKDWAVIRAEHAIDEILGDLDEAEVDLFTRALVLPDILKDIEAGLYDVKDLPFGYKDEAELRQDLAKIDAETTKPNRLNVAQALSRRRQFQTELTEELVKWDLLSDKALEDDRYYHRQVLAYMDVLENAGTRPREARTHVKGFQKARHGGGDFNTKYQEAEREWVTEALRELHMKKSLKRIKQLMDITADLKAEAQSMNLDRAESLTGTRPHANESQRELRKILGDQYVEWKTLIPEGYVHWQPKKGNIFYRGMGVGQQLFDAVMAMQGDVATVLRQALIMGAKLETWIIPENLGATMDNLSEPQRLVPIDRYWQRGQGLWKQWQLLNPARALKYNINNLSGDFDAVLFYPGIQKHVAKATSDLFRWQVKGDAPKALKDELDDLVLLRVIGNTMTVKEIPDFGDMQGFQKLAEADPTRIMKLIGMTFGKYWEGAQLITQYRENIYRLAAYRYFMQEINAGRAGESLVGASNPVAVRALKGKEKAARLATDLIGDYGSISRAGEHLRTRVFPFFSWQEINTKRYIRLFMNVATEGGGPGRLGKVAGAAGARAGASLLMRLVATAALVNAFYMMTWLWNHIFFADEESELRKEGRTNHVILGRDKDNKIITVRIEGAFADFLETFAMDDWPSDVMDLIKHRAEIGDKVAETVKGPVKRAVGMLEPFVKTTMETLTKRSLYPDPFHPRTVRDRGDYVASSLSMGWLYRKVTHKPVRGGSTGSKLADLLVYRTDPQEAAFFQAREMVSRFLEKEGAAGSAVIPSERANALYYWKTAIKWKDADNAKYWLDKYYEMGGTAKGAKQSLSRTDPITLVPHRLRDKFQKSLDAEERGVLELAQKYAKTRKDEGKELVKKFPKRSAPKM